MLRLLIVDDEHLARQALRRQLALHPGVEIVGEAETLDGALREIDRLHPEVLLLDIDLGGGEDGFELLARLDRPPVIVFVTAHAEHAVEAFAVRAVDYLLKPVAPERLAESLERARRALDLERAPQPAKAGGVIALRTPRRTIVARPTDIVVLRADGDFTHVHVTGEAPLMMARTLGHFETLLPSPPFLRLGRSLIVNRDRIRSVENPSRETARVTLHGLDDALELGRAAAARLREALDDPDSPTAPR